MASKMTRSSTEKTDIIETMTKLLDTKLDPIKEKLSKLDTIETSVGYALDEIRKISELETNVKSIKTDITGLLAENSTLHAENTALKEQLLRQEIQSRRNNLKVYGLPVTPQDKLEELILHVLHEIGISITSRDIDRIHYIGPPSRNDTRSVIIRFQYFKDKTMVLTKKESLKQRGISISEDYPQEIQERRKLILPMFFKAKQLFPQLNPKLRIDSLVLAGKVYNVTNIKSIPVKQLQPEHIFTREQQGVTAFYSKHSPLSNHFPADFNENGIHFKSAEQCYMYKKAKHFKDQQAAQQILNATSAVQAKQIGGHIQGFNKKDWSTVSECMYASMYAKFSQNEDLRSFLVKTNKTQLVEANPFDRIWGSGIPIHSDDIFKPEKWKGRNLAGKVLSRVRQTLQ